MQIANAGRRRMDGDNTTCIFPPYMHSLNGEKNGHKKNSHSSVLEASAGSKMDDHYENTPIQIY